MSIELIESEYQRITNEALTSWEKAKGPGKFIGLPNGYNKLGICVGSLYEPPKSLIQFIDQLEQIALIDSALTLIPKTSTHFTFLALAGHQWEEINQLPDEVKELRGLVLNQLRSLSWRISRLRIVPGKNFLLLAGIPDERSLRSREKLAKDLLDSSWRKHIEQRYAYKGFSFPPLIWHTTLCRYQYEILPEPTKELFKRFSVEFFGELNLETPKLRAINYDWSTSILI